MAGAVTAAAHERVARMVLEAIAREYPSHVSHSLYSDADARPPRELTPAFFGSFDWHSAVHGHWCLARLARREPEAAFAPEARRALGRSLTPERLEAERRYVEARPGFERPYGLAWLLQLAAELREWGDADARAWAEALAPLEALAARRIGEWLPKLHWPVRTGEHGQTAFALGLVLDWARITGDAAFEALVVRRARDFYLGDEDAPIDYEPSGHDFLSPALGEADLMRRVLPGRELGGWLARFLPAPDGDRVRRWLTPVTSPDPADGKLAHLDGLNLSRAWMLEGVAAALPGGDPRRGFFEDAARAHAEAGLAALTGEHYAGAHWLGTFAVYGTTRRGLA